MSIERTLVSVEAICTGVSGTVSKLGYLMQSSRKYLAGVISMAYSAASLCLPVSALPRADCARGAAVYHPHAAARYPHLKTHSPAASAPGHCWSPGVIRWGGIDGNFFGWLPASRQLHLRPRAGVVQASGSPLPVGLLINLLIWNQNEPLWRLAFHGTLILVSLWISRLAVVRKHALT